MGGHPTTNARILFAVASRADRFLDAKAPNVASVWAVQVQFVGLGNVSIAASVVFPAPTFSVVFATEQAHGIARLASAAQVQAVLGGTSPSTAIEDNVLTLQTLYDRRADFSPPAASAGTPGLVQFASAAEARVTSGHSATKALSVLTGWLQIAAWWNWVSSLGTSLKASKAQAEAGTDDSKAMTALRTKEAIDKQRKEWDGTATQYAAIVTKDADTTYYVHE